jgi:hypothetical protein
METIVNCMNSKQLLQDFDRQTERMLQLKYNEPANKTIEKLLELLAPLRKQVENIPQTSTEQIPFIIVIKSSVVPPEKVMPLVEIKGVSGEVRMTPLGSADFSPIPELDIPTGEAYLATNVDTGKKTLNVTPHKALEIFHKEKRSPLTIDEGVALVLQFPEVLTDKKKYNCFSVPGSRRNDQRVPAFWISYKKPRLGWCWDNNPHTWLGSASCSTRIGVDWFKPIH